MRIYKLISIIVIISLLTQDIVWASPHMSTLQVGSVFDGDPEDRGWLQAMRERYIAGMLTEGDEGRLRGYMAGIPDPEAREIFARTFGLAVSSVDISEGGDGYIWQGDKSKAEFESRRSEIEENDITAEYKGRVREAPAGCRIYGFTSIVKGRDDFFLGYYDAAQNKLYLATDLISELEAAGPPSLVDEYLLHEILCPALGHYEAIGVQRDVFSGHYKPENWTHYDGDVIRNKGIFKYRIRGFIDRRHIPVLRGEALERTVRDERFSMDDYGPIIKDEVLFDRIHELRVRMRKVYEEVEKNPEAVSLVRRIYEGLAEGYMEDKGYHEGRVQDDLTQLERLIHKIEWRWIESLIINIEDEYGLKEAEDIDKELEFIEIIGLGRNAVIKKVRNRRGDVYALKCSSNLVGQTTDLYIYEEYRILKNLQDVQGVPKVYKNYRSTAISMELIEGKNLTEAGPQDEDFFARLGETAWAIFEKGYTMEDLRDENIMVRADGAPVIIDFAAYRKYPADEKGRYRRELQGRLAELRGRYHKKGLCVTGDTLLPILRLAEPPTSNLQPQNLPIVDVKPGDYVLSLNEETQQIEPHRINGLLDMGIKPVYKLTTASGRSIKTTANHPYLTRNGWVKVSGLRKGDEIACPESLHFGGVPNHFLTRKSVSSTTNNLLLNALNDENLESRFFIAFISLFGEGGCILKRIIPQNLRGGYINILEKCTSLVIKILFSLCASFITSPFFAPLRTLLTLWFCAMRYSATSKLIFSSIRNFILRFNYKRAILFALNHFGSKMEGGLNMPSSERRVTSDNLFRSISCFKKFQNQIYHYPSSLKTGLSVADIGVCGDVIFNSHISSSFSIRKIFYQSLRTMSRFVLPELEAAEIGGDVLWDRIVSIEYIGYEHVYDIEVEGTHNFIGNGIFAHNTFIREKRDVVISSEGTRMEHPDYHRQGGFGEVIGEIANELFIFADRGGRYDLRRRVEERGGRVETRYGELRIEPDGLLVIIDSRFKKDHAGRRQMAVYARNESKAVHELTELRAWIDYAKKELGMTDEDIKQGRLNQWMQARRNSRTVRDLYKKFHKQGQEAERKSLAAVTAGRIVVAETDYKDGAVSDIRARDILDRDIHRQLLFFISQCRLDSSSSLRALIVLRSFLRCRDDLRHIYGEIEETIPMDPSHRMRLLEEIESVLRSSDSIVFNAFPMTNIVRTAIRNLGDIINSRKEIRDVLNLISPFKIRFVINSSSPVRTIKEEGGYILELDLFSFLNKEELNVAKRMLRVQIWRVTAGMVLDTVETSIPKDMLIDVLLILLDAQDINRRYRSGNRRIIAKKTRRAYLGYFGLHGPRGYAMLLKRLSHLPTLEERIRLVYLYLRGEGREEELAALQEFFSQNRGILIKVKLAYTRFRTRRVRDIEVEHLRMVERGREDDRGPDYAPVHTRTERGGAVERPAAGREPAREEVEYRYHTPNRGEGYYAQRIRELMPLLGNPDEAVCIRIFLGQIFPWYLVARADHADGEEVRELVEDALARTVSGEDHGFSQGIRLLMDTRDRPEIKRLAGRFRNSPYLLRFRIYFGVDLAGAVEGDEFVDVLYAIVHEIDEVRQFRVYNRQGQDGEDLPIYYLGRRIDNLDREMGAFGFTYRGDMFGAVIKGEVRRYVNYNLMPILEDRPYVVGDRSRIHPLTYAIEQAVKRDFRGMVDSQILGVMEQITAIHELQHTVDELLNPNIDSASTETSAYLAGIAVSACPYVSLRKVIELYTDPLAGLFSPPHSRAAEGIMEELGRRFGVVAEGDRKDVADTILRRALELEEGALASLARDIHRDLFGPEALVRLEPLRTSLRGEAEAIPDEIISPSRNDRQRFSWRPNDIFRLVIAIILALIFFNIPIPQPVEMPKETVATVPDKVIPETIPEDKTEQKPEQESFEHTVRRKKPDDCLWHIARKYYAVSSRRIEEYIAEYNNRNNPRYKIKDIDVIIDGRRLVLPYRIVHKVRGKNVHVRQVARMYNVSEGYLRVMNWHIPLDGRLRRGAEVEIAVRIDPSFENIGKGVEFIEYLQAPGSKGIDKQGGSGTETAHAKGFKLRNGGQMMWRKNFIEGRDIEDVKAEVRSDSTCLGKIENKDIWVDNELLKRCGDFDFRAFLSEQFKNESTRPKKDEIVIALLSQSEYLFEDCRENGFVGINRQLFEIKDKEIVNKLMKIGLRHELRHEAGVGDGAEDEKKLLAEDVIESVRIGISDKEIDEIDRAGILDEEAGFIMERERAGIVVLGYSSMADFAERVEFIAMLYKDSPDKEAALGIIKEEALRLAQWSEYEGPKEKVLSGISRAIAILYQDHPDKESALEIIRKEALMPAQGIEDEHSKDKVLSNIYQAIATLYQNHPDKKAALKVIKEEALIPAQGIKDEGRKAEALSSIFKAIVILYKDHPDKNEALKVITEEALIPAQGIENESYKAIALSAISQSIAGLYQNHPDKEEALEIIKEEALIPAQKIQFKWWTKAAALSLIYQAIATLYENHPDKKAALKVIKEEALIPAQGIKDEWRKAEALSGISKTIAILYKNHPRKKAALKVIEKEALIPAQEIMNEDSKAIALRCIYRAIATLYENRPSKKEALDVIKEKALIPAQEIEDEKQKARELSNIYEAIAALYENHPDKEAALKAIKGEALIPAQGIGDEKYKDQALSGIYMSIATLYKNHPDKKAALKIIKEEALIPAQELIDRKDVALSNIYQAIATLYENHPDEKEALEIIKKEALIPAQGIGTEACKAVALSRISQSIARLYQNHPRKKAASKVIKEEALIPSQGVEDIGYGFEALIRQSIMQLIGIPDKEVLKFIFNTISETSSVRMQDSFGHDEFYVIPKDISLIYSMTQDRFIKLRNSYLSKKCIKKIYTLVGRIRIFIGDMFIRLRGGYIKKKQIKDEYTLEERIRALVLNHYSDIISYMTDVVKEYGDGGNRHILKGLVPLHSKIGEKRYSFSELLEEIGIDVKKREVIKALNSMGYDVDRGGNIIGRMNLVTSVYRGSAEIDHAEAQYVTHSITTALCHYARKGGEAARGGEEGVQAIGNKALHEVDYALMEYEGVNSKKVDTNVALAFSYASALPQYSKKRTVVLVEKSALAGLEEIREKQEKKRIYEANILNILTLITNGKIEQENIDTAIDKLKEQIKRMKDIVNEYYYLAMYGYMDTEFYARLAGGYIEGSGNEGLLRELTYDAQARQYGMLEQRRERPSRYDEFLGDIRKRNGLWRHKGLSLLGYFRFKQEMRQGTYEERDVPGQSIDHMAGLKLKNGGQMMWRGNLIEGRDIEDVKAEVRSDSTYLGKIENKDIWVDNELLRRCGDFDFRAFLSEQFKNELTRPKKDEIVIALLSQSEYLFEDCKENGFIGVNEQLFVIASAEGAKQSPADLRIKLLKLGLRHELRHEAGVGDGEEDEKGLLTEDVIESIRIGISDRDIDVLKASGILKEKSRFFKARGDFVQKIRAFAARGPFFQEIALVFIGVKPSYFSLKPRDPILDEADNLIRIIPGVKKVILKDGMPVIYYEPSVRAIIDNDKEFYSGFGDIGNVDEVIRNVFEKHCQGELLGYGTARTGRETPYGLIIKNSRGEQVLSFRVKLEEVHSLARRYAYALEVLTGERGSCTLIDGDENLTDVNLDVREGRSSPSARSTRPADADRDRMYFGSMLASGFMAEFQGRHVHVRGIQPDQRIIRNYISALCARTVNNRIVIPQVFRVYMPVTKLDISATAATGEIVLVSKTEDNLPAETISLLHEAERQGLFELVELRDAEDYRRAGRDLGVAEDEFFNFLIQVNQLVFVSDWVGPNLETFLQDNRENGDGLRDAGTRLGEILAALHTNGLIAGDTHIKQFVVRGDAEEVLRIDLVNVYSLDDESIEESNVSIEYNGILYGLREYPPALDAFKVAYDQAMLTSNSNLSANYDEIDQQLRFLLVQCGFGRKTYKLKPEDLFILRNTYGFDLTLAIRLMIGALDISEYDINWDLLMDEIGKLQYRRREVPQAIGEAMLRLAQSENEEAFRANLERLKEAISGFLRQRHPPEEYWQYLLPGLVQDQGSAVFQRRMLENIAQDVINAFGPAVSSEVLDRLYRITILSTIDSIVQWVEGYKAEWRTKKNVEMPFADFRNIICMIINGTMINSGVTLGDNPPAPPTLIAISRFGRRGVELSRAQIANVIAHEYTHALIRLKGSEVWWRSNIQENVHGMAPEDMITEAFGLIIGEKTAHELNEDIDSLFVNSTIGPTTASWIYRQGQIIGRSPIDTWEDAIGNYVFPEGCKWYGVGILIGGIAREIGSRIDPSHPFEPALRLLGRFAINAQEPDSNEFIRITREFLTTAGEGIAHMEGLRLRDGREGLWVNRDWFNNGQEVDLSRGRVEEYKQAVVSRYGTEDIRLKNGKIIKVAYDLEGKDEVKEILREQIGMMTDEEQGKLPAQIVVSLLQGSMHPFEDCKRNGFIGVNEQIFGIQDSALRIKLLKLGLRHELRHESGTAKTELELLGEDVIESVKIGISDRDIETLIQTGVFEEESEFFKERRKDNQRIILFEVDNSDAMPIPLYGEELVRASKDFMRKVLLFLDDAGMDSHRSSSALEKLRPFLRFIIETLKKHGSARLEAVYREIESGIPQDHRYRKGLISNIREIFLGIRNFILGGNILNRIALRALLKFETLMRGNPVTLNALRLISPKTIRFVINSRRPVSIDERDNAMELDLFAFSWGVVENADENLRELSFQLRRAVAERFMQDVLPEDSESVNRDMLIDVLLILLDEEGSLDFSSTYIDRLRDSPAFKYAQLIRKLREISELGEKIRLIYLYLIDKADSRELSGDEQGMLERLQRYIVENRGILERIKERITAVRPREAERRQLRIAERPAERVLPRSPAGIPARAPAGASVSAPMPIAPELPEAEAGVSLGPEPEPAPDVSPGIEPVPELPEAEAGVSLGPEPEPAPVLPCTDSQSAKKETTRSAVAGKINTRFYLSMAAVIFCVITCFVILPFIIFKHTVPPQEKIAPAVTAPASPTPAPEREAVKIEESFTHKIEPRKPNDCFTHIARKYYGITRYSPEIEEYLALYNNIYNLGYMVTDIEVIIDGKTLILPYQIVIAVRGQSLKQIAEKYRVSEEDLRGLNPGIPADGDLSQINEIVIARRRTPSFENIGKGVVFIVNPDGTLTITKKGKTLAKNLPVNPAGIDKARISGLAKGLNVYKEFGEEFIRVFDSVNIVVFDGTQESRSAGAFAHMGENGILYIDRVLLNNDMAIIHEMIHAYLREIPLKTLIAMIDRAEVKDKIKRKAGDDPALLRHYYARYYLQNPTEGTYEGSSNEDLTKVIRIMELPPTAVKFIRWVYAPYAEYGVAPSKTASDEKWRRFIARRISHRISGGKVLSIGTGVGDFESILRHQYGMKVTGIDLTRSYLEKTREKGVSDVLLADGQILPFRDESFDAVVLLESIGHMDLDIVLRESNRVLRPSGEVHIITFYPVLSGGDADWGLYRYRKDAPERLTESLRRNGFRKIRVEKLSDVHFYIQGMKSNSSEIHAAGVWGIEPGQLADILDNLGDTAESFRLREAFIKLIKEDGEITQEELEILVKHIENVMKVIDQLTGVLSDGEKREAIIRIALYLSIEEIRRVKELETRPRGDIRRYFYQRIEVARRLGVSPEEIESINPNSTNVAVVINKYFRDRKERQKVAGKVVDIVTRYLLAELEVDKKTEDCIKRIIRGKDVRIVAPLSIVVEVSGNVILQDLSIYSRENLDSLAIGVIRDLIKGNQQVMVYTEETQKEGFIRLLEEKGVAELQDKLVFLDISRCNSYEDIKREVSKKLGLSTPRLISVVKSIEKRFETKDPNDRIVVAGSKGIVDLYLMWKVTLLLLQSEGDIRSSLKTFLMEYYKGTEYEGKVSDLVEEMFRHGIYIVLPPIVPFMKDYYELHTIADRFA